MQNTEKNFRNSVIAFYKKEKIKIYPQICAYYHYIGY